MPRKVRNHDKTINKIGENFSKIYTKKLKKKNLFYFPEILKVLGDKIMQFWTNQLRLWRSLSHADEEPQIATVSSKVLQNIFRLANVRRMHTMLTVKLRNTRKWNSLQASLQKQL